MPVFLVTEYLKGGLGIILSNEYWGEQVQEYRAKRLRYVDYAISISFIP